MWTEDGGAPVADRCRHHPSAGTPHLSRREMFLQAGCGFDEVRESHIVIQHRVVVENLDAIERILIAICRGDDVARIPTDGRRSAVWGQPRLTHYLRWKRAARRRARCDDADRIPAVS